MILKIEIDFDRCNSLSDSFEMKVTVQDAYTMNLLYVDKFIVSEKSFCYAPMYVVASVKNFVNNANMLLNTKYLRTKYNINDDKYNKLVESYSHFIDIMDVMLKDFTQSFNKTYPLITENEELSKKYNELLSKSNELIKENEILKERIRQLEKDMQSVNKNNQESTDNEKSLYNIKDNCETVDHAGHIIELTSDQVKSTASLVFTNCHSCNKNILVDAQRMKQIENSGLTAVPLCLDCYEKTI